MDILTFFGLLLKPLQPFTGLFMFIRLLNPIDMIGCGGDP